MRAALILMLIGCAVCAASAAPIPLPTEGREGRWRMLDTSGRARLYASWLTTPVTEAEFRKMQRHYRASDFDLWTKRVSQLRPGMTEKEVLDILRPKIGGHIGSFSDMILLDDAYFVQVLADDRTRRMTSTTSPLARTYEIKANPKKSPKNLTRR